MNYFRFPKDPKRNSVWLEFVQRQDLQTKSPEELNKRFYVCSEHFEQQCFVNHEKKRLVWTAVPTLKTKPAFDHSEITGFSNESYNVNTKDDTSSESLIQQNWMIYQPLKLQATFPRAE